MRTFIKKIVQVSAHIGIKRGITNIMIRLTINQRALGVRSFIRIQGRTREIVNLKGLCEDVALSGGGALASPSLGLILMQSLSLNTFISKS